MDKNGGETPNPLNPTPAAAPAPTPAPAAAPAPETAPDPAARPMQQAETATPSSSPKMKKGIIIGIVICLFLAVGCGVTAALLALNPGNGSSFSAAMTKLINGETPANVLTNGDINLTINNEDSPISAVKINLKSEMIPSSLINSSVANVTLTLSSGTEASFEFDEIYADGGDLYFKIENATDAAEAITDDLGVDEPEEIIEFIEGLDGEWLKISTDEITSAMGGMATSSETTACLTNFASDIKSNKSSLAEIYNNNQFVTATTENVSVTSKRYPVYLVSLDSDKLTNFANAVQNTESIGDFYTCMGYEEADIDTDSIVKAANQIPKLYVEIDNDNNFARFYTTTSVSDNAATITIDLNFDYPTNVNVSEPTEYRNFNDVISEIFGGMYEESTTDSLVDE